MSGDCACACNLCDDFEAIRFEKKDFEASLLCCLGDNLVGDDGASGCPPISGEVVMWSGRICIADVLAWAGKAGDRGGDRGE